MPAAWTQQRDRPRHFAVSKTRRAREQAEKARADATAHTRLTVRHLKEQGLSQRDIVALLGLSHQAVSQLLAS